jgi:hypothetical protein
VARQLGPLRRRLGREPDLVIRFVDRIELASPLRHLGVDEAGFTPDAFLVLRSRHGAKARVKIPFEHVGGRCEIVCESGLPAVPLLIPVINLTALARGVAPLHASAFLHRGAGVLVTGWSKGGKTEALLAFTARGAEYLGDEWIYLDPDAGRMHGIPQPIRLWDWHLRQSPQYRRRIRPSDRTRLAALRVARALGRSLTAGARSTPGRVLERVQAIVQRQTYVDVDPGRLFGHGGALAGPIGRVFLLVSSESPGIKVEPVDPMEVADRMVYSVRYELAPFLSYYCMFRFAFPEASNDRIDDVEHRLRALLRRGLAGRPAHAVYHPYPLSLAALFDAMDPLI